MSTMVSSETQLLNAKSLQGKVALVTGAARGIGRAIAFELAGRGATVALNFRSSAAEAKSAGEELQQHGVACRLIKGDVGQPEQARSIVQEVLDTYRRIDILVNNAGITRDRSMRKMDDQAWTDVINTNLHGTYYCTSAALPSMIENKWGRIINISSLVGQSGAFGQANYAASKAGIIAFTKVVALEMARYNITANAVAPGYTSTDMVQGVPEEVLKQICSKIPLGRLATPEEIAKAAAFLITDGDYITGEVLNVNGGVFMS